MCGHFNHRFWLLRSGNFCVSLISLRFGMAYIFWWLARGITGERRSSVITAHVSHWTMGMRHRLFSSNNHTHQSLGPFQATGRVNNMCLSCITCVNPQSSTGEWELLWAPTRRWRKQWLVRFKYLSSSQNQGSWFQKSDFKAVMFALKWSERKVAYFKNYIMSQVSTCLIINARTWSIAPWDCRM